MAKSAHRQASAAVPWWPGEPGEGEEGRVPLTRRQIVEAAMRLADREGLAALSMRRLGEELGAGATSIYWHVRNKDQLLDLMLDEVIGEVRAEVPDEPDRTWRDLLADTARAMRHVILRHHHVAPLMGERNTVGPQALGAMEWLLGGLRRSGFGVAEATLAANVLINWSAGFAIFEARDPAFGPDVSRQKREAVLKSMAAMFASLPADRFPNVIAMMSVMQELGGDDQFEYGLGRMLDGIEAHHAGETGDAAELTGSY